MTQPKELRLILSVLVGVFQAFSLGGLSVTTVSFVRLKMNP